jgi:predicted trehalose synthase
MHAEVTRSVDQMTSAMTTFSERMAEHSANANTGMLKAAAELRATGAQLEEIHRSCANAVTEELKLTMDAYQKYVNEFTHRVDYLASGIVDSLNRLPGAVDDAANGLLDQVDHLSDSLMQAQHALNKTVDRLYDDPRRRQ